MLSRASSSVVVTRQAIYLYAGPTCPLCHRARRSVCQHTHETASDDDDDDSRLCRRAGACCAVLFDAIFIQLSSSSSASSRRGMAGESATSIFLNHSEATCSRLSWPSPRLHCTAYRGDGCSLRGQLALVVAFSGGKQGVSTQFKCLSSVTGNCLPRCCCCCCCCCC